MTPPADWTQWISADYHGTPFVVFGGRHLVSLAALVAFGAFVLRFRSADEATRRRVRYALAAMLVFNESLWHLWAYHYVGWTTEKMLPLHICSALVWVGAFGLVTLNVTIYEFMYFMGIAGPLQAVLTPDAGQYGLPHFRAIQTLMAHGLLIIAALFLTFGEGMRPTWKSVRRVIGGMLIYMAAVTVVNVAIGSDYMWTLAKPPTESLLDKLGPWPWYLIPMVLLGVLNVLVLYLPFWWLDLRRERAGTGAPSAP